MRWPALTAKSVRPINLLALWLSCSAARVDAHSRHSSRGIVRYLSRRTDYQRSLARSFNLAWPSLSCLIALSSSPSPSPFRSSSSSSRLLSRISHSQWLSPSPRTLVSVYPCRCSPPACWLKAIIGDDELHASLDAQAIILVVAGISSELARRATALCSRSFVRYRRRWCRPNRRRASMLVQHSRSLLQRPSVACRQGSICSGRCLVIVRGRCGM